MFNLPKFYKPLLPPPYSAHLTTAATPGFEFGNFTILPEFNFSISIGDRKGNFFLALADRQ